MGLHYNKSIGNRNQAFKYQLKAADQALSRGAFSDGLIFLETACKLAVSKPELKVTSDVITRALRDIVPPPIMKTAASIRRPNNKAFAVIGVNNEQLNLKIEAYKALQARIQVRLEKILNNNKSNVLGGKAPGDVRLTWQPSYVASRMNEFSDSDEDTPTPSLKSKVSMREKGKKKKASGGRGGGLCSIS